MRALLRRCMLCVLRPILSAAGLCVLQTLLGSRAWAVTQLAVAAPGGPLRKFRIPLLGCWTYGIGARVFAHAHWRSLQFWKRVVPIYLAYKRTQIRAGKASTKSRQRLWAVRHAWGAQKVRFSLIYSVQERIVLTFSS